MASKATVLFEIQTVIKNLGEAQAQINKLHLPDELGKKFLSYFTKALAEAEKISKVEGKTSKTKQDQKVSTEALQSLQKIASKIFGEIEGLDKLQIKDLLAPTELKKFEDLLNKIVTLKTQLKDAQSLYSKDVFKNDPSMLKDLQTTLGLTDKQISKASTLQKVLEKQADAIERQKVAAETYDKLGGSHGNNGAVAAATGIYDTFKTSTTFRTRGEKQIITAAQRDNLVKSLEDSVPDVAALMSKTLKTSGSLAEFDRFFTSSLVATMEKAKREMVGYSTDIADKVKSALATLGTALNQPNVNVAQLKAALDIAEKEIEDLTESTREYVKAQQDAAKAPIVQTEEQVTAGLDEKAAKLAKDAADAEVERTTSNIQSRIKQLLGFGAVLHQVSRMVRQAITQIKELDAAMTQIAVVTNFTTDQLWGQIDAYMVLAQQYGVTTTGVYQVSQLYYQQGLNTNEVMRMTTETLKMAKIAGLDYAAATDYMTVAIRGFKLGVEDAGLVVDVYSKLAAIAATDTRELAVAMSKTASIAESAGMSIESTSSFLTLMIETTREAPENLGTAMKTIIARFQEMKKSPLEIVNIEGEEVSLNKVDKALRTVDISLTDAAGQFRNLDEVIFDLSTKWDGLDRNTQRYIATTVAGSRQQSRFLALMSDNQRLTELYAESLDSEDAALLQYAKTLDNIESKINQLSTSFQQFYMSILNGPVIGYIIDSFKNILNILNSIPKAIAIPGLIAGIKLISVVLTTSIARVNAAMKGLAIPKYLDAIKFSFFGIVPASNAATTAITATSAAMLRLQTVAGVIGIALLVFTVIQGIVEAINQNAEDLAKTAEDAKIKAAQSKKDYKDLINYEKELKEATDRKNDSLEAKQKWIDLNNEIASTYPALIARIDEEGNAVVDLGDYYKTLVENKKEAAKIDMRQAMTARIKSGIAKYNETTDYR